MRSPREPRAVRVRSGAIGRAASSGETRTHSRATKCPSALPASLSRGGTWRRISSSIASSPLAAAVATATFPAPLTTPTFSAPLTATAITATLTTATLSSAIPSLVLALTANQQQQPTAKQRCPRLARSSSTGDGWT